jgi:virginiamycin B lyase
MRDWLDTLRKLLAPPRRPRPRGRRRPAVESLEDRTVPSAVTEFPVLTAAAAPAGITRGPDGNLWFAESNADRVGRVTPAGAVTEFPLAAGSGPLNLATGPDGLLYFTERNADRIGRLNPLAGSDAAIQASLVEFPVPGAGSEPLGISPGPDGALWFTEFGSDEVGRITTAGAVTEFAVPGAGSRPAGITAGPDGALWFTEAGPGEVGRITTAGVVTNEFTIPGGTSNPEGITVGPDGALWFTEFGTDQIGRVTTAGVVTEFDLPVGSSPSGIARGPDNALWFTEKGRDRIGRITTAGGVTDLTTGVTSGAAPAGIALGPDGNLWFTENAGNRVGRFFVILPTGVAVNATAATLFRGTVTTFTDGDPARSASDFRVFINWGDGTWEDPNLNGALTKTGSVFTVTGQHLYLHPGTFAVSVRIVDIAGNRENRVTTTAGLANVAAFTPRPLVFARVAVADVNHDGVLDRVVGTRRGAPLVRVRIGPTGAVHRRFFAYGRNSPFGVLVATTAVDSFNRDVIITRQPAGGSRLVKVFDSLEGSLFNSFRAIPAGPHPRVAFTLADSNNDGRLDLTVVARVGRRRVTRVFDLPGLPV